MDYNYFAFGLNIRSALELPELLPADSNLTPQVCIELGKLPEHLPQTQLPYRRYFDTSEGKLLIRIGKLGRILVEDGQKITLDLQSGAEPVTTRLVLINLGLSAVLHQRGFLALHASAVATTKGAVLFCGHRRAGKSTLAAALGQRGWPLVGDDKVAIYLENNQPMVNPSFPRLRLWRDAIEHLEIVSEDFERIADMEKYNLHAGEGFNSAPLPLCAVYLLNPQETAQISLAPLQGMGKFHTLQRHTYANQFLKGLGLLPAHFRLASVIAGRVPITRIIRPSQENRLDELVDIVEAELRGLYS